MFKRKQKNILISVLLVILMFYHLSASAKEKQMFDVKPIILGSIEISVQVQNEMNWSGPIPVRIQKVIGTKLPKNDSNSVIWVLDPPLELFPKDPGPAPKGMSRDYIPQDIRVQSMIIKKDILEVSFINDFNKIHVLEGESKTGKFTSGKVRPPK